MAFSNNAEGFTTDPTTPTTSNTGGGSGTACSTVTQGTSSTIRATNAAAILGSWGYEFSLVNNTGDGACRLVWTLASSTRVVVGCYYKSSTTIGAVEDIMGIRNSSGNMVVLSVGSDGKIVPANAAGTYQTAMKASSAIAADSLYFIQLAVTKGTTTSNGTIEWKWCANDSNSDIDLFSSSAQNAGTTDAAVAWVGRSTGRGVAHTVKYDEISGSALSSGWITPPSLAVNYTSSVDDSASITDSVSAVMTMVREIADSAGITDTPGPQVMTIEVGQDDTAGATDTVSVVASAARTIADQAGMSDSVSAVLTALASVADQAGITDSATSAATMVRVLGDPAAITDTATAIVSAVRQVDDSAGATDAASVVVSASRTVADVAGITDSVTATIYIGATADDTAGATDAVEVTIAAYRSPAEAIAASDTVATILSAQRQTDDQAGITDAATSTLAAVRQVDDGAGITDDASVLMVSVRTISDGAAVTDTVIAVLGSDIPAEGGDIWAPRPPIRLIAAGAPIRTYAPRRRA